MTIQEILEAHYVTTTRENRVWCKACGHLTEEPLFNGEETYLLGVAHQAEVLDKHMQEREAKAWELGAQIAWQRSSPTVNGSNYYWRSKGEPVNPHKKETPNGR